MNFCVRFLFSLILFLPFFLFSQEELKINYYDVKDGLSSSWVNSVIEDDRGFVWAGTRTGLSILNGNKCEVLYKDKYDRSSISGNDVSFLHRTFSGEILAGTWGDGLNIINPYTKKSIKPLNEDGNQFLNIKTVLENTDSTVWIGSYGRGFYEYDKKSNRLVSLNSNDESSHFDNCETMCIHNDTVWIATRTSGLAFINPVTKKPTFYKRFKNQKTLIREISVLHSSGNALLVGTMNGDVYEVSTNHGTIIREHNLSRFSDKKIRIKSILSRKDKSVWVSTSHGISRKQQGDTVFTYLNGTHNLVNLNDVFCMHEDTRGILWLGTWGTGLANYHSQSSNFKKIKFNNFNSSHVNTIYELDDSSRLIASTEGLLSLNTKTQEVTRFHVDSKWDKEIRLDNILSILDYKDSLLLIFTAEHGFFLINKIDLRAYKYNPTGNSTIKSDYVTSINKLQNGMIWIATWSDGAYSIDTKNNLTTHYTKSKDGKRKLNSNLIYCSFIDHKGDTWLGTKDGLVRMRNGNNSFEDYPLVIITDDDDEREIRDIKCIVQDSENNYWFASSSGLVRYNMSTRERRLFNTDHGLLDQAINSIVILNDQLWGVSQSGLVKINLKNYKIKNYTKEDGLLQNSFKSSIVKSSKDLIYICNGSGLEYFDPNKLTESEIKPDFFLHSVLIDDEEDTVFNGNVNEPISFTFNHTQNNISFKTEVLDFRTNHQNIFAHKLDGFDNKWMLHDANHTTVRYTNLEPGDYKLVLADASRYDLANGKTQEIHFHIKKPYYKTWWFIIGVVVSFLLLLFLITQVRTSSIRKKNKELEAYASDKNKEVKEINKNLSIANDRLAIRDEHLSSNLSYASYIQSSLQPNDSELKNIFDNYFIFYKPKDVVSGDFYWSTKVGNKSIFVLADCTGHGVSGAFVSVIGVTFTRAIIKVMGITSPNEILNKLHHEVRKSLHQETSDITDGMDVSVICFNHDTGELEVSSALGSVLIVDQNENVTRIKGDRFPVGGKKEHYPNRTSFTLHKFMVKNKTMVYLYTDGFQDQFGAKTGKKFMHSRLRELLIKNSSSEVELQKEILNLTFEGWRMSETQVDDVLVVGIELR